MNYIIRSINRRNDMAEILRIERANFPDPWTEKEFQQKDRKCLVCEENNQIVGFLIYHSDKTSILLSNLAVDPIYKRQGIGRHLVQSLFDKMKVKQDCIESTVLESNLSAQLFFKSMGFKARRILKDFFTDEHNCNHDGYDFVYRKELVENNNQKNSIKEESIFENL